MASGHSDIDKLQHSGGSKYKHLEFSRNAQDPFKGGSNEPEMFERK